jgi:tyrosinase
MAWSGRAARGHQGPAPGNATPPTVRQNIAALSAQQIQSLKRGVAAMKARPGNDPRSWQFQANIHGTLGPLSSPLFAQCEHGTIYFFAWHRGYLYFFERILRAAAQDPTLTLPYWDWSTSPALPAAYRDSNPENPLFDDTRDINDGSLLPSSVVVDDLNSALASIPFDPDGFSGFSPSLEGSPHGAVHTLVGGRMSLVPTSANDPIFWLHHCNIDRIWDRWLNLDDGRMSPTDSDFLDRPYSFADEGGQTVTVRVRDILTSAQLGYRYDNVPNPAPPTATMVALNAQGRAVATQGAAKTPVLVASSAPAPRAATTAAATGEGKPLGLKAETVKLNVVPEAKAVLTRAVAEAAPGRPKKVLLDIQGITFSKPPNFTYEVFLNLPDDEATGDHARLHHVGTINFFGRGHTPMQPGHGHGPQDPNRPKTFDQTFDVTSAVARLRETGHWEHDALSVTLRPLEPAPPKGKEDERKRRSEKAAADAKISYKQINLRVMP